MNQKYSPEMRERALRMLEEAKPEHPNLMSALRHVAGLLGMSPETLRVWHRRREIDAGQRPGVPTDVVEENKRLRRENAELKKANEVLKAASVFFRERTRPSLTKHDLLHRRTQGSVRGRVPLPRPPRRAAGVPHLARVCDAAEDARALRQAAEGRTPRPRDPASSRGELRRLRPPEDACAPPAGGVGHRA